MRWSYEPDGDLAPIARAFGLPVRLSGADILGARPPPAGVSPARGAPARRGRAGGGQAGVPDADKAEAFRHVAEALAPTGLRPWQALTKVATRMRPVADRDHWWDDPDRDTPPPAPLRGAPRARSWKPSRRTTPGRTASCSASTRTSTRTRSTRRPGCRACWATGCGSSASPCRRASTGPRGAPGGAAAQRRPGGGAGGGLAAVRGRGAALPGRHRGPAGRAADPGAGVVRGAARRRHQQAGRPDHPGPPARRPGAVPPADPGRLAAAGGATTRRSSSSAGS